MTLFICLCNSLKDEKMSTKKVLSYVFVLALLLIASSVTVTTAQELSGELSVYLNAYYDPAVDAETAALTESIAQKYMDEHPGVTITLVPSLPAGQDLETFLAARMAANESPDIMWQQF